MADDGRRSHVVRIYKDDDPGSGVWVDVERVDKLTFETGSGLLYEKYIFNYDWSVFDPEDPNTVEKKEIKNPNDDSLTIKVPIRRVATLEAGNGLTYQRASHIYGNDPDNLTRVAHTRRVDHYDIPDNALDQDKQPPPDPTDYINAVDLNSKDDGQYIEVEVIARFISTSGAGLTWQKHIWNLGLANDPLLQFGNDDWLAQLDSNESDTSDVDPPWRLDPLQNIVNISWGADVIVVFVAASPFETQPAATYTPKVDDNGKESAKYLSSWNTPYSSGGLMPGFPSTAYRVSSSAGEFITSVAPRFENDSGLGFWIDCFVFAVDGSSQDSGLQRAIDGTHLIESAIYLTSHTAGEGELASDMAPPGLLWAIETGQMQSGQSITWKIRHGPHRNDGFTDPPDSMTQVYPLTSFSGYAGADLVKWAGYILYAYRLDKDGTETVYSKMLSADEDALQSLPSGWDVPMVPGTTGIYCIPYGDPPPYITEDLITS
jgi:hypothetical protein